MENEALYKLLGEVKERLSIDMTAATSDFSCNEETTAEGKALLQQISNMHLQFKNQKLTEISLTEQLAKRNDLECTLRQEIENSSLTE